MAYVGDWNETPNSCHKKELVDTIRNLLVIDGFVYEDALWRTSIRAVVKEILDEFHTDTFSGEGVVEIWWYSSKIFDPSYVGYTH